MSNLIKNGTNKVKYHLQVFIDNNLIAQLVYRYFHDSVGVRGAALAYYLLFSVFPLVILLSTIISRMNIDMNSVFDTLSRFLPKSMSELIMSYLHYIQADFNQSIMNFAIVFSIYFPWRAIKGLMHDIRKAFRQDHLKKPYTFLLRELFCTITVPLSILISLFSIVLGRKVILDIIGLFPPDTFHFSNVVLWIWNYARFVLAAFIMTVALATIYRFSLNHGVHFKQLLPGTFGAVVIWVVAGMVFSFYSENYASYSVVYGTLGAVIVLLLWLYLTGVVFIMGAEFNAVLLEFQQRKAKAKEFEQSLQMSQEKQDLQEEKVDILEKNDLTSLPLNALEDSWDEIPPIPLPLGNSSSDIEESAASKDDLSSPQNSDNPSNLKMSLPIPSSPDFTNS